MQKKIINKKVIFSVILLFFAISSFAILNNRKALDNRVVVSSRKAIEYAEEVVRTTKPAPTESSRLYAYTATAYYDVLHVSGNEDDAYKASVYITDLVTGKHNTNLATSTLLVIEPLVIRIKNDKHDYKDYVVPKGEYVWVDRDGDTNKNTPFTPNAGNWLRWIVQGDDFKVPPPPDYKSNMYLEDLKQVHEASANRTPEQGAAINFWGGIPGTNQPAGIWLDRFFEVSKKYSMTNEEFAYKQMILAQTLADAFMECWKVKYTYWTKRPDMVDEKIETAMNNPPFPSYVSGHSTISAAAATVLGEMFPKDRDLYMRDAIEAKESRLWAGIHFPYDNEEGFKLGVAIGKEIIRLKGF